MTTSSANNSVFKGFFEKQKLPIPPAPVALEGQQVALEIFTAHTAWIKRSKEIAGLMLMTMKPKIQRNLENLHAHEMLLELKTLFAQQAERELLQTTRDFSLLQAERKAEFDGFVQNYNMHSLGKTINELHAMLKLHVQTLPKNKAPALHAIRVGKVQKVNKHKKLQPQMAARGQNHRKGKNKLAYAPKPKIPPPPKREDPAKDPICHECGETRHWKRNCPQYLAELLKKKKNVASGPGGSGIFVIELNTIFNGSWIYDTGCGTYIFNTTQGLRASRKLKPRARSLYAGNGQREAVEAIGVFCLCPSNGFLNRFVNNTIQVSRNNMVYFSAIPRDGIFEIDLSNSYTNENSMYAVSNKRAKLDLDSTLLWHCRLRHISKKRIEMLQHDGLLNSTDLRAFEKCFFCMYGKTARKPYAHQVKRAKDLLGLIHTDVCSPFKIMSRQGAKYFVTFTEDFSRYGYVDLLKHKHEVFETFKVFQNEVKNQLGKTIKSLCFDRGGEYMSQEFLDHLKDHEIIAHRTPPYTPQHNRVSERRNRTLLDMVHKDTSSTNRMCLYIDAEEHELGDLGEPANYKAALLDPESDKWFNAMNVEIKWLFKKKIDMDEAVQTYKARLVAKGYTQTLWIDYEETFSHVADIRAIRILIAITVFYDYEIWQMDVKTTFLNGYLSKEVYMEQPEGFVNLKYPNRVCKLKRSIYGLKQASKQWNKRFDDEIKKFGFTQNRDEPCVYLKASGSNITFLILYVDDILIMGNNILVLQDVKSYIGKCFAMKDLGEAAYILGIKIYKDRSRRLIGLCQSAYIEKILKRYHMENSKHGSIPMQEKLRLSKSQEAEYIAAFDASKEAVWVRKFIYGLGVVPTIQEPIGMYCDNTGAITIANESVITKGARYFRAKVHYLREVIEYGDVKLEKVHTDDNLADPFTKALAFSKHSEHTKNIEMFSASSLMIQNEEEVKGQIHIKAEVLLERYRAVRYELLNIERLGWAIVNGQGYEKCFSGARTVVSDGGKEVQRNVSEYCRQTSEVELFL
uniref:Retrotransposon protein, putative, Ty1-copia subclass n=1 Tax=Tanacetum cinerariifolium TaxID=118510 RepID=A0A6L2KV13_TANCI|nr:retrotransposon protein, putative, Ty1-copia subclass [Tanacetum cinerariifolium]